MLESWVRVPGGSQQPYNEGIVQKEIPRDFRIMPSFVDTTIVLYSKKKLIINIKNNIVIKYEFLLE